MSYSYGIVSINEAACIFNVTNFGKKREHEMGLFDKLNKFISSIASVDNSNKPQKSNESVRKNCSQQLDSIGVDISSVLNDPTIKNILTNHAVTSCNEIINVPQECRGEIAKAVLDNFYGTLPDGKSLLQQLISIHQMPKKEATLIARDQTSKLTARLNQAREEAIGIKEYIWCAVDNRCNHLDRNKKKYKWSSPPTGGHPGQSYLCMCHAAPVINVKQLARSAK